MSDLGGKPLNRREFTSKAIMTMLAGVTVTVAGCSDDESPAAPSPAPSDRAGVVAANHGHSATVTAAQLSAGAAVTLTITGTADHPHTVMLTMGEVGQIAGGARVVKTSSTNPSPTSGNHSHTVTFN
jgi:hypothetical protein